MRRVRHHVAAPGGRHRGRRRAVERRLLPALPVQGRAGRRHPRGRHRAAAELPRPPDGQGGDARGPGPPLGRGRAGPGRRRGHRRRPPSPCCGTAAAWARACRRAARRPAGPLATLLREPFADLGSADPDLDASLAAHAVVGTLSDHLWDRARPSAGRRSTTSSTSASPWPPRRRGCGHDVPPVPAPDAHAARHHRRAGAGRRGRRASRASRSWTTWRRRWRPSTTCGRR